MTYDRDSFLAGFAVGRVLKKLREHQRSMNLQIWEQVECSPTIQYNGENNVVSIRAISGYYERIYYPALVEADTDYRFSVRFSGTFREGNKSGRNTYFAVCKTQLSHTYIEDQGSGIVLGKTRLYSSNQAQTYTVNFNSGNLTFVWLCFDFAAIRDGTSVQLTFGDVLLYKL